MLFVVKKNGLVRWFWSNNNRIEWWISKNRSKSWNFRGRFIFIVLHCWIGQLHTGRILLLSIIGSLCGRLFNSNCCAIRNDSRFMDLWNESILWRYPWHDWHLSRNLLAHLLEICGSIFLAIYHRLRIVWTSTVAIWWIFLSRLGQCSGMVYSWIVSHDDSTRGNHTNLQNTRNISTGWFWIRFFSLVWFDLCVLNWNCLSI